MPFISSPEGDLKTIFLTDAFLIDQFVGSTLWNWGYNYGGNLGNNSTSPTSTPVQTVAGGANWAQVAGGRLTTIGIKTDGTLWMWGYNRDGTLGINLGSNTSSTWRSSPVQLITGGTTWQTPSIGNYHAGCVKNDGTLWMWGYNTDGELGDNSVTHRSSPVQTVAFGSNWLKLGLGGFHTGCIKRDNTLWLWGLNANGQIGDNSATNRSSPVQVLTWAENWSIPSNDESSISACIKTDGTLWVWGQNDRGQLGDNTVASKSSPIQTVAGGNNWSSVATGYKKTYGLKTDGTLWGWGNNQNGDMGDNTVVYKSSPVQTVAGGTNWSSIAASSFSAGGLKTDGTLWIWGGNGSGEIGDNTTAGRSSPVQTVTFATDWAKFAMGGSHVAAIKKNGTLWCWGSNFYGQLGDNTVTSRSSPVETVTGGNNWIQVACGSNHTVGLKTDGTLWVWGYNQFGSLGDNTLTHRSSPVQTVAGGTNWKSIAAKRGNTTAAIKTDNTIWGWGFNSQGQLGDGTLSNRSSPVQILLSNTGRQWARISAGGGLMLVGKDGTLWISGLGGNGQLGNNTTTFAASVPVQPLSYVFANNWNKISLGDYHSAGVKTNGTLWTWGRNTDGQLGDNTKTHRSVPVQTIAYDMKWKDVACGYKHTAGLKNDGTLWCWGGNAFGQLGDNTTTSKSSPIQTVTFASNWKQIDCGYYHTAAIKYDSTLWTWGDNEQGALGDNSRTHRSSPVQTTALGYNWKIVNCGQYHTMAVKNG